MKLNTAAVCVCFQSQTRFSWCAFWIFETVRDFRELKTDRTVRKTKPVQWTAVPSLKGVRGGQPDRFNSNHQPLITVESRKACSNAQPCLLFHHPASASPPQPRIPVLGWQKCNPACCTMILMACVRKVTTKQLSYRNETFAWRRKKVPSTVWSKQTFLSWQNGNIFNF